MEGPQQARAQATVERILDAALATFRTDGFRGGSISSICKRAKVSAGHLYHYFSSKEAIVAAIVDRDRSRIRSEIATLLAADSPIDAMVTAVLSDGPIDQLSLDPLLTIEIYAEATRNPEIAALLHDFDRHARSEVAAMLKALSKRRSLTESELDASAALLLAIVDGVQFRRAMSTSPDIIALAPIIRQVLQTILDPSLGNK